MERVKATVHSRYGHEKETTTTTTQRSKPRKETHCMSRRRCYGDAAEPPLNLRRYSVDTRVEVQRCNARGCVEEHTSLLSPLRQLQIAMSSSKPPSEHWEVATQWRDVPPGASSTTNREAQPSPAQGEKALNLGPWTACGGQKEGEGQQEPAVVSLGLLRTCFSERYGAHIPRMFHDLVLDIGQAFATAAPVTAAAGSHHTHRSYPEQDSGGAVEPTSTPPSSGTLAENNNNNNNNKISHDDTPKKLPEKNVDDRIGPPSSDGGDVGGPRHSGSSSSNGVTKITPPVFHVTEYDVTRGRYPLSWEDHAGYIIPGGTASACGEEPWMKTLLHEVKGLRETDRPVLGFCLGHQVLAHGLGGLVQPRTGSDRHYALQESELLFSFAGVPKAADAAVVSDAVSVVRRQKDSGIGGGSWEGAPPLRLLYHHNDEVVKLPPDATNISTSPRCEIHGMIMVPKTTTTKTTTTTEGDGPSSGLGEHFTPNLLTFQAHPELNYEYGREVMSGMLDGDVALGRITHEEASRLKEQVLAWDHEEFPVALELMRRLFAPIVPPTHGGTL